MNKTIEQGGLSMLAVVLSVSLMSGCATLTAGTPTAVVDTSCTAFEPGLDDDERNTRKWRRWMVGYKASYEEICPDATNGE